jgi:hypothetical protein
LLLNRSSYSGPAVRINTNRVFLRRAMQLGFSEVGISSLEAPIVCRESHRTYAWQPLNGDAAIEPADNVIRIQSSPGASSSGAQVTKQPAPRRTMNERAQRNGHEPRMAPGNSEQTASEAPGTNLTTLIKDAEAVHATLSDAKSSLARLVSGLRRHRKQARLLSETLRSLKQLKLTEVAE